MWLKPVIGLIAAIAVGVGAAFVAVRFAPVTETDTSVASVEALVLQPIPDDAPFPEPGGGGATTGRRRSGRPHRLRAAGWR